MQHLVNAAIPLSCLVDQDYKLVLEAIGDASVVLIGEASHGTQEFYEHRAALTQALIRSKGFTCVLCEGDFPPFYTIHRYVTGESKQDVKDAMEGLNVRFPRFMWYNQPTLKFIEWLKEFNMQIDHPVGMLGMDIYSLFQSAEIVLDYLDRVDPILGLYARKKYATLGSFGPEASQYTHALMQGRVESQASEVACVLTAMHERQHMLVKMHGDGDEFFNATENARVVQNAEAYYRKAYIGGNETWNIRDQAMHDMVKNAIKWQEKKGIRSKVVIWAHNSHVGDTSLIRAASREDHLTLGQLCRASFGNKTYIDHGSVRAATDWGGPDKIMDVNPSIPYSSGHLLSQVAIQKGDFGLIFKRQGGTLSYEEERARMVLLNPLPQRFIGVQYIKWSEIQSHYTKCCLSHQYDLVIHLEKTRYLEKCKPTPLVRQGIDYSKWDHMDEEE